MEWGVGKNKLFPATTNTFSDSVKSVVVVLQHKLKKEKIIKFSRVY